MFTVMVQRRVRKMNCKHKWIRGEMYFTCVKCKCEIHRGVIVVRDSVK